MKPEENIITPENPQVIQFPVSLRDYFAGQALAGIMANTEYLISARDNGNGHPPSVTIASNAYNMADAMLSARSTGGEKP